jgi:hypothetical protein
MRHICTETCYSCCKILSNTMLNKISVKNFRAIRAAELELAPITVLYGPTASGKSSLLYAPLVLRNFVTNPGRPVDAFFDLGFINLGGFEACIFDHSINKSVEISLSGEINGEELFYGVSFSKDSALITAGLGDFRMKCEVPLPYPLNQTFAFKFTEGLDDFDVNWTGLASIVIPQIETDLSLQKAQSIAVRLNQTSELLNSLDIAPHRRGFFKPQYVSTTLSPMPTSEEEVASIIINNQYLAAKISRYSEEICDRDFRTYTVPGTQQYKFQTSDIKGKIAVDIVNDGFGINQIMYLWTKILRNEVRTELIEEPEAHLHPSIVRRFARTLSKLVEEQGSDKQVVLATHSEQFVASLLAAVREKILPSGHLRCYLTDKSGSSSTFETQMVNDDGQIEGGLVTFVESQLEDMKSLFGIS